MKILFRKKGKSERDRLKKRDGICSRVHMYANTFTHARHTHSYNIYAVLIGPGEKFIELYCENFRPEEG